MTPNPLACPPRLWEGRNCRGKLISKRRILRTGIGDTCRISGVNCTLGRLVRVPKRSAADGRGGDRSSCGRRRQDLPPRYHGYLLLLQRRASPRCFIASRLGAIPRESTLELVRYSFFRGANRDMARMCAEGELMAMIQGGGSSELLSNSRATLAKFGQASLKFIGVPAHSTRLVPRTEGAISVAVHGFPLVRRLHKRFALQGVESEAPSV